MDLIRLFRRDPAPAVTAAAATEEAADSPRRAPRVDATEAGLNREVKLSPGGSAELLNVSETGILVEGKTRLSTGSKVLVTLVGRDQKRLTGRVVRCQVCAIHRDGTMTYQTALALDQPAGLEITSPAEPVEAVEEEAVAAAEVIEAAIPEEMIAEVQAPPAAPRLVNEW